MTNKKIQQDAFRIVAKVKYVTGLKGEDTGGKGPCPWYKPGDEIVFDHTTIKGNMCYSAVASMMYKILPMRFGLDYPWHKSKGVAEHVCPDPDRPVIFEIRREE